MHSVKRLALASFLVGLSGLLAALAVYTWSQSALYAALTCLLVGFIILNVTFLTIVPSAHSLEASKNLICAAVTDPKRIVAYNKQKVQLRDAEGNLQALNALDMLAWSQLVVPHLIVNQSGKKHAGADSEPSKLTASERKYIEQRWREVLEIEKTVAAERKSLEADRRELDLRTADLNKAEEVVIARLSGIERAEAELEQLKIAALERSDLSAPSYDLAAAKAKEAELRNKEAELARLREHLAEDRKSLDRQKSEVERLNRSSSPQKEVHIDAAQSARQSLEAREAALEDRLKALEEASRDIEERATYLAESENSLIERLDDLSYREANVEQTEINTGLREEA